ncbi:MAG TPA: S8 family serine peptidase [Pseudonocardiaceae bacterium]|nr:S8 family serine peptidase [Pseudonocardiaceae bacterium]
MKRLLLVFLLVLFGLPIGPAAADPQCAAPSGVYTGPVPWAQLLLAPGKAWPLSNGSGVQVAVLGTGVDPGNAQFAAGQVQPGIDLLGGVPSAPDCDGQGTFAAGIVGAQTAVGTNFAGLAPGVRILPVRYTATADPPGGADPNLLAAAIDGAVRAGSGVILIMDPALTDSNALQLAVQDATAAGDVVISPAVGSSPTATSYPTATPGVIGVGALGQTGFAVQAEAGAYISLAAPAANLVGTAPGARGRLGQRWPVTGAAYAAAYVAGSVALLRSYKPGLDPAQISTRLLLTASHNGGTGHSAQLGWGVVDPDNALTANVAPDAVAPTIGSAPGATRHSAAAAAPSVSAGWSPRRIGLLLLLIVGVVAVLLLIARVVRATVRRSRSRRSRGAADKPPNFPLHVDSSR